MAVAATHLSVCYGVGVRQAETALHLQMAVEAHFCRFLGVNNRVSRAAALDMQAAGAMATLAADVLRVHPMRLQPSMRRGREMLIDVSVAFRAGRRTDKLSAGNFWWNNDNAIYSDARN